MLMAAIALPFGSTPSPNGWMPQFAQKRCLMTCLLNVYVLNARFRRLQAQLVARHEPQQRAFALADRAIASERTVDRALDLERHVGRNGSYLGTSCVPLRLAQSRQ